MNKLEVVSRLKSGEFSVNYEEFSQSKRYKSNIWDNFGRVYDNYVPLDFVCCKNCRHVYPYNGRFGTSSLLRHKCTPKATGRPKRSVPGPPGNQANSADSANYSYSAGDVSHDYANNAPDQAGQGFEVENRPEYGPSQNTQQMAMQNGNSDFHASRSSYKKSTEKKTPAATGNDFVPEKRNLANLAVLEKAKIRAKIDRLQAETEFWKAQTKKTQEEMKKLQLEQLRLQKDMGIMEVVEQGTSAAEYLMVENAPHQHHQAPMQPNNSM